LATLRYGQHELPLTLGNEFLAHLQVAAHQRFSRGGGGFFLTATFADSDGVERTVSFWLAANIPLEFRYDVRDESDNRLPPVLLDHGEIEAMLEAMERPAGVHATTDVWLSFTEPL
jgi:hypothetical protein